MTLASYQAFLGQAYHHVRHTTPLLMPLGGRLPERLAWLRGAVAEYIDEEIGHEEWILNDIAAAGGDAAAVRASQPELPAELMVSYAYDLLNRGNPAGFFGMVFVLEGTSAALALHGRRPHPTRAGRCPTRAFSYLRSHGPSTSSTSGIWPSLLNKMTPDDQAEVLRRARASSGCTATFSARCPRWEKAMQLNGARILLTGASGGFGEELARQLAGAGAALLLAGRDPPPGGGWRRRSVPGRTLCMRRADRAAKASPRWPDAAREFGVNVLINNAGIGSFGMFEQQPIGRRRTQMLATNLVRRRCG